MIKRLFDIVFALPAFILLLPLFIVVGLIIIIDSRGGVFYKQLRVGKNSKQFYLYKFRTMQPNADQKGLLTVGGKDKRVTRVGYWLRKYKIDELPQLLNVLIGNMSLVGPRPETPNYVELYDEQQLTVLTVKPGITDYASIEYSNENELLAEASDPEQFYINTVMPAKLKLNQKYIAEQSLMTDLKIIFLTILKIIGK